MESIFNINLDINQRKRLNTLIVNGFIARSVKNKYFNPVALKTLIVIFGEENR